MKPKDNYLPGKGRKLPKPVSEINTKMFPHLKDNDVMFAKTLPANGPILNI